MPLVVATITAPLDRLKIRKFLLPVAQDMGLDVAQVADFTNGEVALVGYRRQLAIIAGFQHRPQLELLVFVPGEMSPPDERK